MKITNTKTIFILILIILMVGFVSTGSIFAAEPYHLGFALGLTGTGRLIQKRHLKVSK